MCKRGHVVAAASVNQHQPVGRFARCVAGSMQATSDNANVNASLVQRLILAFGFSSLSFAVLLTVPGLEMAGSMSFVKVRASQTCFWYRPARLPCPAAARRSPHSQSSLLIAIPYLDLRADNSHVVPFTPGPHCSRPLPPPHIRPHPRLPQTSPALRPLSPRLRLLAVITHLVHIHSPTPGVGCIADLFPPLSLGRMAVPAVQIATG